MIKYLESMRWIDQLSHFNEKTHLFGYAQLRT